MDDTPRQLRMSTTVRGVIIGLLIALYAWMFDRPAGSWIELLLVGAGLQLAVLVARRLVPPDLMPQAMYVLEMIADGVTVLLFAIGVLGPTLRLPDGL